MESASVAESKYGTGMCRNREATHHAAALLRPISSLISLDRWHTLELVDLVRFNSDGKIATIREYFDTRLIHDLIREHEANLGKKDKKEEQTAG